MSWLLFVFRFLQYLLKVKLSDRQSSLEEKVSKRQSSLEEKVTQKQSVMEASLETGKGSLSQASYDESKPKWVTSKETMKIVEIAQTIYVNHVNLASQWNYNLVITRSGFPIPSMRFTRWHSIRYGLQWISHDFSVLLGAFSIFVQVTRTFEIAFERFEEQFHLRFLFSGEKS